MGKRGFFSAAKRRRELAKIEKKKRKAERKAAKASGELLEQDDGDVGPDETEDPTE